ncbi:MULTISPECIES: hypothetical protein [Rhodobacterales]|uniref:hypothetical protein n=1 Tax=Rhodobacterales TaxID=204455 RepID=UPI0032987346
MKRTTLIILCAFGLGACGDYQGPNANCFERDTVARSSDSLSFLQSAGGRVSTSAAPVADCNFVALDAPKQTEAQ